MQRATKCNTLWHEFLMKRLLKKTAINDGPKLVALTAKTCWKPVRMLVVYFRRHPAFHWSTYSSELNGPNHQGWTGSLGCLGLSAEFFFSVGNQLLYTEVQTHNEDTWGCARRIKKKKWIKNIWKDINWLNPESLLLPGKWRRRVPAVFFSALTVSDEATPVAEVLPRARPWPVQPLHLIKPTLNTARKTKVRKKKKKKKQL